MMRSRPHHSTETGFTLLEVLVSVTLIAMIAVGMYSVFRMSIRSWSRGAEFIDANQHHRSMLDMVRKQIASAYPLFTVPDSQQGGMMYPIFSGSQNGFSFVSLSSLQFLESPGLTFVSYEIAEDSNGAYALVGRETRYTGKLPDDITINESRITPVFENLINCSFEYFDSESTDSPWVQEWEGQDEMRLPSAVSIAMTLRDSEGNTINRRMVVPLKAEAVDTSATTINPFGNRGVVGR